MRLSADVSFDKINVNPDIEGALLRAAQIVADGARELCPVDTGALKASISASASGNRAVISAGEDYAAYVEFGTSKAPAQPFLVPALINNAAAAVSEFAAAMGGSK